MQAPATIPDTIGVVRLRGRTDTPALRSGVRAAVARADLPAPTGSAHAVLIVRRSVARFGPGAGGGLGGLADDVGTCWQRAARPAAGPVPADAPAVVFRDLAELLAHLAVDLVDGRAGDRWWWRSVARRLTPSGQVVDLLADRAELVPEVLEDLGRLGRLRPVVDGLGDTGARRVVAAVARAHGAPRLADVVALAGRPSPRDGAPPPGRPVVGAPAGAAPWARWVGEGWPDPCLPPSSQVLLAVTRLLVVRAAVVRTVGFAAAVDRWWADPAAPGGDGPSDGGDVGGPARPAGATSEPRGTDGPAPAGTGWSTSRAERADRRDGPGADGATGPASGSARGTGERQAGWAGPGDRRDVDGGAPASTSWPGSPPDRRGEVRTGGSDDDRFDPAPRGAGRGGVVTHLGGVLLLVDLARELDLPDVFEPTCRLASHLAGWGAIDAVARALVPATPPWTTDPVWSTLAALSGVSPVEAGASMPAPVPFVLPAAWQEIAAPPSGAGAPRLDATLAAGLGPGVRRWLALVVPFVVDLVCHRLEVAPADLRGALLVRPARVVWDRTHLDVHYPLDSATVPVRRAGLDRDPGWVPALARVIAFHYDTDVDDAPFGGGR